MSELMTSPPTEQEKLIYAREGWELQSVNRQVTVVEDQGNVHGHAIMESLTYFSPGTGETQTVPVRP